MSDNKEFEEYHWNNLLSDNKKEAYLTSDKNQLTESVKNFANQFSPRQGFLGLKGRKMRDRKDSIEFILKTRLVDNEKEAEEFIDRFKDKIQDLGLYRFRLIECKEFNQDVFYKAKFESSESLP
jgi:hypothetical protein